MQFPIINVPTGPTGPLDPTDQTGAVGATGFTDSIDATGPVVEPMMSSLKRMDFTPSYIIVNSNRQRNPFHIPYVSEIEKPLEEDNVE